MSKEAPKNRGRPKTNTRVITSTSQAGTKENETRATFIVNEEQLECVKILSYWKRISIKEAMSEAIDDYLYKNKSELIKYLKDKKIHD